MIWCAAGCCTWLRNGDKAVWMDSGKRWRWGRSPAWRPWRWDPYITSVREHVPGADGKIVFDKFHVAQHLGEAVYRVRRKENKTLRAAGDDRLTGTRYDWLGNPAAMESKDRREFAELRTSGLKTATAWALKETAMALYSYI